MYNSIRCPFILAVKIFYTFMMTNFECNLQIIIMNKCKQDWTIFFALFKKKTYGKIHDIGPH